MKKLVGAAIATGLLLGAGETVNAQENNPQCQTLYDETLNGDNSTALRQEITSYNQSGVDVHVQIIDDGTPYGIVRGGDEGKEQAADWREYLIDECEWSNTNAINIIVTKTPRVFETYRTGQVDIDISQNEYLLARERFIKNLQNSSTPYQSDIAILFKDINPYDSEVIAQTPNETTSPKESKPLNIPVREILVGLVGLAVISGIGSRLYRGHQLKAVKKRSGIDLDESITNLSGKLIDADESLSNVHENDALDLRGSVSNGWSEFSAANLESDSLDAAYKSQRFKLWPSIQKLNEVIPRVNEISAKIDERIGDLVTRTTELLKDKDTINEQVAEFESQLSNLKITMAKLTEDGWDLTEYDTLLIEFQACLAEVIQLRQSNFIDTPSDIIEEQVPILTNFHETTKTLPTRLESALATILSQESENLELQKVKDATLSLITKIKTDFDPSCLDGIENLETEISDEFQGLLANGKQSTLFRSDNGQNIKSAAFVEHAETLITEYNEISEHIRRLAGMAADRQKLLERIIESLPNRISSLQDSIKNTHTYAFEKFAIDVEQDTRDQLTALEEKINEIINSENGLNTSKPAYLNINNDMNKFETNAEKIYMQAKLQKEEMDTLRPQVSTLEDSATAKLINLKSYFSANNSDIDRDTADLIDAIEVFRSDIAGSRQDLKEQVRNYTSLISRIDSTGAKARAEVRNKEDAREAKRLEKQRQVDAASSASYSIPSYTDSGSSDSGGTSDGGGY